MFCFSNPAIRCTSLHTPNRLLQNTFSFANFDNGCSSTHWNYFSFPFYYFLPPGVQASIHLIGCRRILLFLPFLFSFANSDNGCSSTHSDFRFFSLLFLFKILPLGVHASIGKIALHLLFGWSLDKDKKVWINPNNSHESLDRSKLRPSQTPTNHPSEFFGHITFSVPNIKL